MTDRIPIEIGRLRTPSQILFGIVFISLFTTGRLWLWVLVFAAGLLTVRLGGRWYCGWACPIDAAYRLIGWVYERTGVTRRSVPSLLKGRWIRWGVVALLALAVAGRVSGRAVPVILLITLAGIVVGLVFVEETFHRHLCPFGTVLAAAEGGQGYGLDVNPETCSGCGECQAACPNDAIDTRPDENREIQNRECLTCFACERACPTDAISYDRLDVSLRG